MPLQASSGTEIRHQRLPQTISFLQRRRWTSSAVTDSCGRWTCCCSQAEDHLNVRQPEVLSLLDCYWTSQQQTQRFSRGVNFPSELSPRLSSWCSPWLRASQTITFWRYLFLSSPQLLANLMLWWGRSLALIQIMFQSLLEDLKPSHGPLEDGGNEACWDFNHFYICWKIRRKETRKKTERKEKSTAPLPLLLPASIPFLLWKT